MQKQWIGAILLIVVAGGAGFMIGTRYAPKIQNQLPGNGVPMMNGAAAMPGGRGVGAGRFAQGQGMALRGVTGEVLTVDGTTMTVKLRDGGSKIVLFSNKTTVGTMTDAALVDVVAGAQVMVTGEQNSDGSVNAQRIQLLSASTTLW